MGICTVHHVIVKAQDFLDRKIRKKSAVKSDAGTSINLTAVFNRDTIITGSTYRVLVDVLFYIGVTNVPTLAGVAEGTSFCLYPQCTPFLGKSQCIALTR